MIGNENLISENNGEKQASSTEFMRNFSGKSQQELEHEIWPFAKEQQEKSVLFINRLRHWKPLLIELSNFAKFYLESHSRISQESSKLLKLFDSSPDVNHQNTLHQIDTTESLEIVQLGLKKVVSGQELVVQAIDKEIVDILEYIVTDYAKNLKLLTGKMEKTFSGLKHQRSTVLKLFESHFSALENIQYHKSSDSSFVDPWLSEKAITEQLKIALSKENEARKSLLVLHQQIQDFEEKLVDELKKIIPAFLSVLELSHRKMSDSFLSLERTVNTRPSDAAFVAFKEKVGISSDDCFHKEISMSDLSWDFDPETYLKQIVKQGYMERQATIRKSVFKPAVYAITESGFLHCFNLKTAKQDPKEVLGSMDHLQYSIYLKTPKMTVAESNLNVNCIEINVPVVPKPIIGAPIRKYLIKAKSKADIDEWVEEISKHLLMNRERPVVFEE